MRLVCIFFFLSYLTGCDSDPLHGSIESSSSPPALPVQESFSLDLSSSVSGYGVSYQASGGGSITMGGPSSSNLSLTDILDTTGLAAYYKLDIASTGLIGDGFAVVDELGLSPGTTSDPTPTMNGAEGRIGNAIEFNDTDYIAVPSTASLNITGQELTLMAWAYVDPAIGVADPAIVCKGNAGETYMLGFNDGVELNFRVNTDSGFVRFEAGSLPLNEWILVTGTYDGTNMILYMNGVEVHRVAQTGNILADANELAIGKRCVGDARFLPGRLDEVSIWSRALTADEINQVYIKQNIQSDYQTQIISKSEKYKWESISWSSKFPSGKPLLGGQVNETLFGSDSFDMNMNLFGFSFEEDTGSSTFLNRAGGTSKISNASCVNTECPTISTDALSGHSLHFDGVDDVVSVPHNDDFLIDEGSVSIWFKTSDSVLDNMGLVTKDASGFDNGGHFSLQINMTAMLQLRIQSNAASNTVTSVNPITVGKWNHVVATFGSGGMKIYLNGNLEITGAYTGGLGTSSGGTGNTEDLVIGAGSGNSVVGSIYPSTDPLNGFVDEVYLFNRQLSLPEVTTLYERNLSSINVQVRSCQQADCADNPDFLGPDGTSNSSFSMASHLQDSQPNFDIEGLVSDSPYFQFKFNLQSYKNTYAPEISNVSIKGTKDSP